MNLSDAFLCAYMHIFSFSIRRFAYIHTNGKYMIGFVWADSPDMGLITDILLL